MIKHRILLYAPTSPVSGVTCVIKNLFGNLDHNEFVFDIISLSTNEKLKSVCDEFGGEFYTLDVFYLKHPVIFRNSVRKIMSSNRYEAVVFNISYLYTSCLYFIAKSCNISSILFYSHSSKIETNSLIKRATLEIIHKSHRLRLKGAYITRIACSEEAGKWLFGDKVPFVTIKNGISTEKFAFNIKDREELRRDLGIENCKVIGNVGRLSYPKNQQFLIKAFAVSHKLDRSTVLLIMGEGPDRNKLTNLIRELGLENCCRLLGNRQDINKIYSAIDLFVLPSVFEGAPVSAIEAQDNGVPCLISDSVSQDIKVNKNVKFVPINSVEMWGNEMVRSLSVKRKREADINLKNNGWDIMSASQMLRDILLEK